MQFVAPHPCFGCAKIGTVLCDYCKYNIIEEPFLGCIVCRTPHLEGVCIEHHVSFDSAYIVGLRQGVLQTLIDALKFRYVKAAARVAAELLHERLPVFPEGTIIVPIPTVASHIRQRGYDQVALIARYLAQLRDMPVTPLLERSGTATQHVLNKAARAEASKSAFRVNTNLWNKYSPSPKLILDDIVTTGATVLEASTLLSQPGVPTWIGAVAYQPLD